VNSEVGSIKKRERAGSGYLARLAEVSFLKVDVEPELLVYATLIA